MDARRDTWIIRGGETSLAMSHFLREQGREQ